MYEQPMLVEIGSTEEVILGIACIGGDIDGALVTFGFGFLEDASDEQQTAQG